MSTINLSKKKYIFPHFKIKNKQTYKIIAKLNFKVAFILQNNSLFLLKTLVDLIGVHKFKNQELYYELYSLYYNTRLSFKIQFKYTEFIKSLVKLYQNINWYEREVWDLFGVFFKNHPNLYRILTDYSFEGHPFRKDFPLSGYFDTIFDANQSSVGKKNIKLVQESKHYDFFSFINKY